MCDDQHPINSIHYHCHYLYEGIHHKWSSDYDVADAYKRDRFGSRRSLLKGHLNGLCLEVKVVRKHADETLEIILKLLVLLFLLCILPESSLDKFLLHEKFACKCSSVGTTF